MSSFELKSDLPKSTQEEIDRIEAITSTSRTTSESNFLTALTPYLTNAVLRYRTQGITSPQTPDNHSGDILEAEGETLPSGYTGFSKGARFYKVDDSGMIIYHNTGSTTNAVWSKLGQQVVSSSPSLSASPSASQSPSSSASPSASPSATPSSSPSSSFSPSPSFPEV